MGDIVNRASEVVSSTIATPDRQTSNHELEGAVIPRLMRRGEVKGCRHVTDNPSELTEPLTRILTCETIWGWSQKTVFSCRYHSSGISDFLMAKG